MLKFTCIPVLATVYLTSTLVGCGLVSNSSTNTAAMPPTVTSIALSPQNSAVIIGKTLQLQAMATLSDGSQQDMTSTATWACSNTAIATVQGGVVNGVGPGVIQIEAASGSISATTWINVTSKRFGSASLSGRYAFTLTSNTARGLQVEAGSMSANGNGNITGIEDLNAAGAVTTNVSVTGTYSITPDGRGTITLKTSGQPSRTLRVVLSANSSGAPDNDGILIEFDGSANATGIIKRQDSSAFQNSALSASTYVFRSGGLATNHNPTAAVGLFTTDVAGTNVASGQEDVNDNGTINDGGSFSTPVALTAGTIGSVDSSTGRVTVTLTAGGHTSNFAAYVISPGQLNLIGLDASSVVTGTAEKQANPVPSSLASGGYVFDTEIGNTAGQFWIAGQFQLDSTSSVISLGQYQDGGITLNIVSPGGKVTVAGNGRGTLVEDTNDGARNFTIYLVSATHMYLLETDDSHAAAGVGDMQQPGPDGFGVGTLNNSLALSAAEIGDGNEALVAAVVADGSGNLAGLEDLTQPQPGNPSKLTTSTIPFIAKYSVPSSNGIAIADMSTSNTSIQAMALFFISPNKALALGLSPNDVTGAVGLQ